MWSVTLKDLRTAGACVSGYNKVVSALKGVPFDPERETYIRFAHKKQISILSILETNDFDDALWATQCIKDCDRDLRLFAVWCARQVEYLNDDPRVKQCNDISERFANGLVTSEELAAARVAAWKAARAAAGPAAVVAAGAAAWSAARNAACEAARAAAWNAAGAAALNAAQDAQKEMFINMLNGEAPWQVKKDAE